MSKTIERQRAEAATINAFLDLCAPSLDPEVMGAVREAVSDLCGPRHIDRGLIQPWGIEREDWRAHKVPLQEIATLCHHEIGPTGSDCCGCWTVVYDAKGLRAVCNECGEVVHLEEMFNGIGPEDWRAELDEPQPSTMDECPV